MKINIYLLLLITSAIGYSQTGIKKAVIINPPALNTITATITNVTGVGLNDGAIGLNTISGGTPGYTISWSDIANPLQSVNVNALKSGTYRVKVTDSKGCIKEADFTVHQPDLIKVTIDQPTKIACFGGNGNLKAQAIGGYPYGGTANYTYSWFKCDNINGDNPAPVSGIGSQLLNVKTGFYMVTVIDNQNATIAKDIKELEQNPQIQISEIVTPVSCRGDSTGSIKLTPSGGASGTTYSIVWSDNVAIKTFERTGLTEGTYRYTITDDLVGGCSTATMPVIVKEPALDLDVTYTSKQPTLTNNNGEIKLNATGGILPSGNNTYTYQWSKVGDPTFVSTNVSQRTDLVNGTYNIAVTSSSGCIFPAIIVKLEALNLEVVEQNNVKCFGTATGSLTVKGIGGTVTSNYSYKWFKNGSEITGQTSSSITGITIGNYRVEVLDDKDMVQATYIISEPTAVLSVVNTLQQNASCKNGNDGKISVSVSGGTIGSGYEFLWSNGSTQQNQTNLTAGIYSVTVTDANGCQAFLNNILITEPSIISIPAATITHVVIFGESTGEIFLGNVTGGNGGYIYKWSSITYPAFTNSTKDITGIKAGSYTLLVTDNKSCTATQTFIVNQNPLLEVALTESLSILCNGDSNGKITATVQGGVSNYTYEWYENNIKITGATQDFIDGLGFGKYKVIVKDNVGATKESAVLDLIQPDKLVVSLANKLDVLCFGNETGIINIDVIGGTKPYTFEWKKDNNSSAYATTEDLATLKSGVYSVLITDKNNCEIALSNITITQPNAPLLITDVEVKNLSGFETKNGSIEVAISGGTPVYTYAWRIKGTPAIIGNNSILDALATGTYELTITDSNNCTITKEYTLIQPDELLITGIVQTETVKCFDNKQGILKATITGGAPIGTLDANKNYIYKWYNQLTPAVIASTTNPSETLRAGTYLLEVSDGFGNSYTSNPVTIIQPDLLKINYTQTNVSCNGQADGDITIAISGGTGPYTIVWSTGTYANQNTLPNLLATTYNVTVTDSNLCVATQEVIITEPQALGITVVKTPPSALGVDDASIEVTVTGGTPNYNFKWYDHDKNLIYTDDNQKANSIYNIYVGQYFITITDANGCKMVERDLDQIDPLLLKLTQINIVKCKGDATASIKAITSGGLPGYYYKWYDVANPAVIISEAETLTNVKAGIYYVIVTDSFGKSIQSENITIAEPLTLKNALSSEYTRCGDGNDWTITSTTSGGTTPYTYLWSTGAKTANLIDVIPGNYSLLITDKNGCTVSNNTTVVAPIHLATSETIKIPTCYGGSDARIELTSSGGQAPYTYLWDTGEKTNVINSIAAGIHKVTITDSKNCVITKEIAVANPPKEVINIGEDMTLCIGQSVTINATVDDNFATYSWTSDQGFTSDKPIITVSKAATYTLVVTNKLGCQASDAITIAYQDIAIDAVFAVSSQVFVNESFVIVDISNPKADSIEWILPAEATVTSKDKEYAEMSFSKAGEYEMTLITRKGNCSATQTKKILVIDGEYTDPESTDLQKKFDMKIYPNPSNGIFTVDVTLDKIMSAHVKVYNLINNAIVDSKVENGKDTYKFNFNLNGLTAGVYFVLFESQQGNKLRKIIIQ